jgi:hypothetical protein
MGQFALKLPDKEFRYLRTVIVHDVPYIAIGRGPYLHPSRFKEGALRMASEDSRSSARR